MCELGCDRAYYHLISRGRNRGRIFYYDEDRWMFLNLLRKWSLKLEISIHAWVLMDNHVHLLVGTSKPADVSTLLKQVNGLYAKRFNHLHCRSDAVWKGRPRILPVCHDSYFRSCQLYIELNPHAALISSALDGYEWSSARFHLRGVKDNLTSPGPWFLGLSDHPYERQVIYRGLLQEELLRMRSGRRDG
jgi:putative transposase